MPLNRGWAHENHPSVWRRGPGVIPLLPGSIISVMLLAGAGVLYTTVHKGWATFVAFSAVFVIAGMTPGGGGGG